MPPLRRFFCLAAANALLLSSSARGQDPALVSEVPPVPSGVVSPVIVPAQKPPAAQVTDDGPPPVILPAARVSADGMARGKVMVVEGQPPATTMIDPSEYRRVYSSIPFNRAEYNVNPNYRHDTTMEILTGTARHQTIVQHNHEHKPAVKRIPHPELPSRVIQPNAGFAFPRAYPFWFRGHVW